MFGILDATSSLVWLKGNKGFVYTESQPTGSWLWSEQEMGKNASTIFCF